MEYVICSFCGHKTIKSRLGRHLSFYHNKTIKENTLKRLNLSEEMLPKCKFCENKVAVSHEISEICDSKECYEKWLKEKRHLNAQRAVQTQIERGIHPFAKENLKRDENGKSIIHSKNAGINARKMVENGTHPWLHNNLVKDDNGKSLLHIYGQEQRVKNGTHPWSKENLKRDENGKSIVHKTIGIKANRTSVVKGTNNLLHQNLILDENGKSIMHKKIAATRIEQGNFKGHRQHNENWNVNYIKEHFLKDGYFELEQCCQYFNVSESFVNTFKRENSIMEPNRLCTQQHQQEVYDYIRSIYGGQVLYNDRTLIGPKEIDIVIPDKHLAIEFDGLNFHAAGTNALGQQITCKKGYHLDKTIAVQQKGYQLLHIFENEWLDNTKREIWKSILMNKLSLSHRIYARKCFIKEVSFNEAKDFLEQNHIQGSCASSIRLGLYHNNELVALMTFAQSRFNKHYDFELMRFCNLKYLVVIGGASKLFHYFAQNHLNTKIVSYANRRWSNGNLYKKLGFTFGNETPPDYFYFLPSNKQILLSRMSCQKHKLSQLLGSNFDANLSETANMLNNGYMKIFDCGHLKYSFVT